jgi:hypothetical protein
LKKLARIGLVLLALAATVTIVAYWLAKKYEPEVRTIVLYELNRHLNVEVKVDDINFSLLQRFPYASLRFSEVVIPQVRNGVEGDTLIYIKDLYLQIGLLDFLSKNYRISEADINTGFYRMDIYADGSNNYQFWKSAGDTISNSALSLTNIELKDFGYRLRSGDDMEINLQINKAEADGDFGTDLYDIVANTNIQLNHVISSGDTLFRNQPIDGAVVVNINQTEGTYGFSSESIELGKEDFLLDGSYISQKDKNEWRLELTTTDAKIEHLAELMPLWMQSSAKSYKARGKTDLKLELKSLDNQLDLDVLFEKTHGSFQHQVAMGTAKISDAAGSLQLRNGVTSLYLDKITMGIGPGEIKAFGKIINFNAPAFDLNIDGLMDLEEFKNFVSMPLVERLEGKLIMNGRLHGKLPMNGNDQTLELLKGIDFIGDISLKSGAFKLKNQDQTLEKISGDIDIKGNALIVNNATGEVNGSKFEIEGAIQNALPYLSSSGQRLHIAADFRSPSLDFNEIWSSESSRKDTVYEFQLPQNVSFDLGVEVGKITFRKFEATQVQGRAYYKNGLLTLNPFNFKSASGSVLAQARVERIDDTHYSIGAVAKLKDIAVDQLFYQFEDFGQTVVKSTHIEGTARADISFDARFTKALKLDPASISSNIDLIIARGKLKKLEAFKDIADYLRENALWRSLVKVDAFEKKLDVVAFDTLQNTIKIENSLVTIPAMRIGSSAMTIGLSGTHRFDNTIDYSLNFKLSDLLRTGKKQNEEFGYVVEDPAGLRLFMRMTGTTDNPEFSLDKDGAREKRKRELEKEKNVLKSILKEEFGLFKSDTTLQGVPKPKEKPKTIYELEWDGFDKTDSSKTPNPAAKKPKTKPSKSDDKVYDGLDDDDDL